MGLYLEEMMSLLACVICFVALLCFMISDLYKTWRQSLSIDEEAIQGHVDGVDIKIYWQDVIVMRFVKPTNQPNFLLVGTRVGDNIISLNNFNDKQVWQAVQHYAPPSSLEEEAYKRLPDYDRWKDHHKNLINRHIPTLSVKIYTFERLIFRIILFSCLIFMIPVLLYGDSESHLCIYSLSIFCVLPLALFPSSIEADMDSIRKKTWLGRYKIRWDEIERIEHTRGWTNFVFYGENKRLVIPGFMTWSGGDQEEMIEYLQAQITERSIETKVTFLADYKWSKNVKVE